MRWWRGLLVPAMLCLLIGCATRPEKVFEPLAFAASDAGHVDMLVATKRKPSDDRGQLFSGDRGTAISLNNIVVSIPPDRNRKVGEIQWPLLVKPDPEKEFAVLSVGKIASQRAVLE